MCELDREQAMAHGFVRAADRAEQGDSGEPAAWVYA
jgi:hypothetical protein